jgi:hypothetical protein
MKEFGKYFFIIFAAGLVLYFGLRTSLRRSPQSLVKTEVSASMLDLDSGSNANGDDKVADSENAAKAPVTAVGAEPPGEALVQYQKSFQSMGQCFDTPIGGSQESVPSDFSPGTLEQMISQTQGDIATQNEEWSSSDIRLPTGEVRRLLVQSFTDDPESEVGKKLTYSTVTADGTVQEMPLSDDQKRNPSESLIASLESDGQVSSRSQAKRIFFQNGGDLFVTEKDGALVSYEYTVEGKTFRCSGLDSTPNCKCF